jgi:hypothetical protein
MIRIPELLLKDIQDVYIRENFRRITLFFQDFPFFRGEWAFFEREFAGAVTNEEVAHGLGFKPLDVIQTSKIGAGSITFNFSLFTDTHINVTTTGACTVRFFVGAYKEESGRRGQ